MLRVRRASRSGRCAGRSPYSGMLAWPSHSDTLRISPVASTTSNSSSRRKAFVELARMLEMSALLEEPNEPERSGDELPEPTGEHLCDARVPFLATGSRDGEGAALLRREVFALFMGLFARGCVSPVLSSGGQQPSQHVPASFRRPAEPRNGTEYRRSVPLGRAPLLDIRAAFWYGSMGRGTDL